MKWSTEAAVTSLKVRKAHAAVANAVRRGDLTRKPCEVCGLTSTHAHHQDYDKPLDVRWLCSVHHHAAHRKVYYEPKEHGTGSLKCLRCFYRWNPRGGNLFPHQCPNCKSRYWDGIPKGKRA